MTTSALGLGLVLAASASARPQVDALPTLPSRSTTYVIDATQSTGSMENFREIWVSPVTVAESLQPAGEKSPLVQAYGGAKATDLPVRNDRNSYASVNVNGVDIGVVGALTHAVVHGVKPGIYTVAYTYQNGFAETREVATRTVTTPLTPGSVAGAAYVAEPVPSWNKSPADGYQAPPPPPKPKVKVKRPRVKLGAERIEINDRVAFAVGSAQIEATSHGLLDEIAGVLRTHPELMRVEIQGHTDASGNPAANRKLSQARAESVMGYLTAAGIDATRLSAVGFGPDRPRVAADSAEAKAANRRVELHVLERAPPAAVPRLDADTPED